MNLSPLGIRKLLVGLLSLGCLMTAVTSWFWADQPLTNPVLSVTTKLGLMLGALWLTLPSQGENIAWQKGLPVVLAVIGVLAFIKRAQVLLYVVPIAIVVGIAAAFLRPKARRRPPRR